MSSYNLSAVTAKIHDPAAYQRHKAEMENIESNVKESEVKVEAREEHNKTVTQEIDNESKKFNAESDTQVRKALMMQLNSPFPTMATEVRLKNFS